MVTQEHYLSQTRQDLACKLGKMRLYRVYIDSVGQER